MRIAVMGSGGVGGYFGGRLAEHGEDVHFVARGEQLQAMRSRGLTVRSTFGDFHIDPVQATSDPAEIGPVDVVLFAVKMWDTESAAHAVTPLIGPNTAVISFQNGVEAEEVLATVVGREHVMGGAAYVFSSIAEPGVI